MNTLENNEVLNGLLNKTNDGEINSELGEILWDKIYNMKKFYWYLTRKLGTIDRRDDFWETPLWKDYDRLYREVVFKWEDRIPESEVRRIMKERNEYLCTKRESLREPFTQDIPYFRASYLDKDYYLRKINDRSLPVKEYEKMQDQIEKHGSILARSNKRNWEFGGWDWDVILSLTTWKLYDVEWEWSEELEKDYNSKQYYSSRSWASWAWKFMAWKWSLIYMPTSRMDVKYPELCYQDINGLNMTMCSSRWEVDESLPTIIKSWKVNLWVDAVLLSQRNHLEQWAARDLINTIETKGENLKNWPVYTFKIKYFDENFEEKEKVFTYKTNMYPKEINLKVIWRECFWIKRWFDVEDTWSFIDKMAWIKKYNWKYVRLWQFGLVKEVFDEHPTSDMGKSYYDDIEIWDKNEIIHKKVEVEPMFSDYNMVRKFNWWILWDKIAYKNIKNSCNPCRNHPEDFDEGHRGYYIKNKQGLYEYNVEKVCSEHGIEYNRMMLNDDVYYLVYEDDISEYSEILGIWWQSNMEFEYYVPRTIFEQFSIDYWKKFLSKKLKEKIKKGINISLLSETTQKNIALNYIKSHQNTVFTLQDSYDSWNCHPGTARFVEAFNLSDKILGRDLLKHKDFEKMLSIYDFRKIFVRKALRK